MGIKGDKNTNAAEEGAQRVAELLEGMEGIEIKKMFGGRGLFHDGKMFGIIDTRGDVYLKDDPSNKEALESSGRHQHSRMPYFSVGESALADGPMFESLAKASIALSKA